MAVPITTGVFVGVDEVEARVRQPITMASVRKIARDQDLLFELLTGLIASGTGAASTTDPHDHSEEGNLLYWTLAYQAFGDGKARTNKNLAADDYQTPIYIEEAATPGELVSVFPYLLHISPAWVGRTLYVILDVVPAGRDPLCVLDVLDDTITLVSSGAEFASAEGGFDANGNSIDLGGGEANKWIAAFVPAASGFCILNIKTRMSADMNSPRDILSVRVVPQIPLGRMPRMNGGLADVPWETQLVQVGDPTSSETNSWIEMDEALTEDDGPLDACITLLAVRDAFLQGLYSGIQPAGTTSMQLPIISTQRGHDHSDETAAGEFTTFGTGKGVVWIVGCWAFGGLTRASRADISGQGSRGPHPQQDNTPATEWCRWRHWFGPASGLVLSDGLNCAVLTEHEGGAGGTDIDVTVSVDGNAVSTGPVANTASLYAITEMGPIAFTPNAMNEIVISVNNPEAKGVNGACLAGLVLYFKVP